jgi:hypothetical protein
VLFVRKILLARKWLHGQISVRAPTADLPGIPGQGDIKATFGKALKLRIFKALIANSAA